MHGAVRVFAISLFFASLSDAKVLTLMDVQQAVRNHPELRADQLQERLSEINLRAARLKLTPSLSATQNWAAPQGAPPASGISTTMSQSLNVNLNLFRGFQDLSAMRSQSAGLEASREQRHSLILQNTKAASEIFLTCLQLEKNSKQAEAILALRQQLVQIEKARFERGVRSRDGVTTLELDANNAYLDLRRFEGAKKVCYAQLSYWTGEFDSLQEVDFETATRQALQPSTNLADLSRHPDLLSATHQLEGSRWDKRFAQGAFLPTLNFSYSNFPETSYQKSSDQWLLVAQFNLWDSGVAFTRSQTAHTQFTIATEKLAAVRRQLESQVTQSREQLHAAYDNYHVSRRNLELGQTLLASSLKRFKAGTLSANDVALDQNRVALSQLNHYDAWLQMNLAWIRYQFAMGEM